MEKIKNMLAIVEKVESNNGKAESESNDQNPSEASSSIEKESKSMSTELSAPLHLHIVTRLMKHLNKLRSLCNNQTMNRPRPTNSLWML
mmetsp:Transcript_25920/g.55712  ORF Transcript_25920/g.55712 Transcript_25920/m.55712 type:complete len:89 (+) Transcript_25920:583-849(+)